MADDETQDASIKAAIPATDEPVVESARPARSKGAPARSTPKTKTSTVAGASAIDRAAKGRRYSKTERDAKVHEIELDLTTGKTLKAATKCAGVSEQTYYNWKRGSKRTESGPSAAPSKSVAFDELVELEVENLRLRNQLAQKLRAENAELRKRLSNA